MKKNSLSTKGLSMSQAQSISNLCNQRSRDITAKLSNINNYSRKLTINKREYIETTKNEIPSNIVSLLNEKASLHATQAFLMENIKAKDDIIQSIKNEKFDYSNIIPEPEHPETHFLKPKPLVDESWGWEQLSSGDYNMFLEAEAYAAHIGQFIHKGGTLDKLRTEIPTIKTLEFMEIEVGKKSPMLVEIHHTSEQLLKIHEELSSLHRGYEQKVNYFKSKIKNLVTSQNSYISQENAMQQSEINEKNKIILEDYSRTYKLWLADAQKATHDFESKRQKRIEEAILLKIDVDILFQPVVDIFLKQLE